MSEENKNAEQRWLEAEADRLRKVKDDIAQRSYVAREQWNEVALAMAREAKRLMDATLEALEGDAAIRTVREAQMGLALRMRDNVHNLDRPEWAEPKLVEPAGMFAAITVPGEIGHDHEDVCKVCNGDGCRRCREDDEQESPNDRAERLYWSRADEDLER